MVAYQPGKAANIAAPAVISHTSLPSHSGPIVLIAVRRPGSSPPTTPCTIPTPKSKPSSTKKPVHRTAISRNQNSTSVNGHPLVLHRRDAGLGTWPGLRGRHLGWLAPGEADHQHGVDDGDARVDEPERH